MIWLILLADYRTFRICIIFLFIICILFAEILTCSDAVDFFAYSLGMQYSVVTADQGCSTEMVMMLSDNIGFSWENTLPCQHAMTAATSTDSSALHGQGFGSKPST